MTWPGASRGPGEGTEESLAAPAVAEPAPVSAGVQIYPQDLGVAALGLFLAIAAFFPWYSQVGLQVSGWGSGTWGPLVFFLGLGVALLIGLRRAGVKVALPVEEPLLLEGAAWLAAFGVALKAVRPPTFALLKMGPAWGTWLSLVAAVGLALLAGRMSPRAPLVWIPGWYRGTAGRAGVLVLGGVLAGSLGFGLANDSTPGGATGGASSPITPIKGKLPKCAKELPVLKGLRPTVGYESSRGATGICVAQLTGRKSVRTFAKAYETALGRDGWKFSTTQNTKTIVLYQLTKPRCGSVLISKTPTVGGTNVTLTLNPCAPSPPPGSK